MSFISCDGAVKNAPSTKELDLEFVYWQLISLMSHSEAAPHKKWNEMEKNSLFSQEPKKDKARFAIMIRWVICLHMVHCTRQYDKVIIESVWHRIMSVKRSLLYGLQLEWSLSSLEGSAEKPWCIGSRCIIYKTRFTKSYVWLKV